MRNVFLSMKYLAGVILLVTSCGPSLHAQSGAPVVSATPIKSVPFTITKPGVYVVKKDLNYSKSDGTAITILATGVTLDLGGHTISATGSSGGQTYGIFADQNKATDVTIRNGCLVGFNVGISMTSSNNEGRRLVERIKVLDARRDGITIRGQSAEVRDCAVLGLGPATASAGAYGITSTGVHSIAVGNRVCGIKTQAGGGALGIYVVGWSSGLVERNVVSGDTKGGIGIYAYTNSGTVFVRENYVANFTTGISFAGGGKYLGNLTADCTTAFLNGTAVGTENN